MVRNDQISLREIEALSPKGIVMSPGPGRPEEAGICVELVKKFKNKIPILGVCLGHQAIAVAFGAKVECCEQVVHGKESLVFHNRAEFYQNVPLPFGAGRYHSLTVDRASLPKSLKVNAETHDQIVMGIEHEHYPIFGVQFHPESILSDSGMQLLKNFLKSCKRAEVC